MLSENEVWDLVKLPQGRKAIGCKWIYKIKVDADGEVDYFIEYGNNLISYPFENAQDLGPALGDAAADIYAIAGEGVAALAISGQFVGSLTEFVGGSGYWLVSTNEDGFDFNFNGTAEGLTRTDKPVLRAVPEVYSYHQSDQQSFFFVQTATINNEALEDEDIVIAYNGDVIVGSRYWNG